MTQTIFSKILLDRTPLPCNTSAPPLWSHWDVLKAYGYLFCYIANSLAKIAETDWPEDQPLSSETQEGVKNILIGINGYCGELNLIATGDRVKRIATRLKQPVTRADMQCELHYLNETLEDELKTKFFVGISSESAGFYQAAHLFGEPVSRAFPSAAEDIQEGGTAYACGCHTAAVFHFMRAAERMMRVLAWDRRASVKTNAGEEYPIDLATWEDIIKSLNKEIDKVSLWPRTKGEVKTQALEFYNTAIEDFRGFKEAWRNHIMHSRRMYIAEDAKQVMEHVRRLAAKLATRISEDERTPTVWTKAQLR